MKQIPYYTFNANDQTQQRIALIENQLRVLNNTLNNYFIKGRLRTDRTAPIDSNDVQTPDELYDWVINDDYAYIVVDDAGSLKWRRITLNVF